jgi:hypothetical protein
MFASPLAASFLMAPLSLFFCAMSGVKPPPWIMNHGITRWKIRPSKKPSSTYDRKLATETGAF